MGRDEIPPNGLTLADRLAAAIAAAGLSNRGLAVKLAGGTGDKVQIERWRKSIRRMLSGGQKTVQPSTAVRLSRVLDVPAGYWPTERATRPRNPVENAEELFKRLDAGEEVAPHVLEAAAAELEETAREFVAMAGALRSFGAIERSEP